MGVRDMKNEKMDWNKNAMDYETTDQYLYKDIRNKKIDGLFLRSFNPHKIIVHPHVNTFYKKLEKSTK